MLDVTAFAALIKRKRGEARLTQETLALDVFGDPARKADISRLENGKVQNPQEATVQKICAALSISPAEMEPIRQARPSAVKLSDIPTLSLDALQVLASKFGIEDPYDQQAEPLRQKLSQKANEHRALVKEIEAMKGLSERIDNIHAAALDAARKEDFSEANELLENAREIHVKEVLKPAIETNARISETQAELALIQGNVTQAFHLLKGAADSFSGIDESAVSNRKISIYSPMFGNHADRYGGEGWSLMETMLQDALTDEFLILDKKSWAEGNRKLAACLERQAARHAIGRERDLRSEAIEAIQKAERVLTREGYPAEWAQLQHTLAIIKKNKGRATDGPAGIKLIKSSIRSCKDALKIRTPSENRKNWAATQNCLALAYQSLANRFNDQRSPALFEKSVEASRAILAVLSREEEPTHWASVQLNIGITLKSQGILSDEPEGTRLFLEAIGACKKALLVRNAEEYPIDFAETHEVISHAEFEAAKRLDGKQKALSFKRALWHINLALEVYAVREAAVRQANALEGRTHILAQLDTLNG